MWTTVMTGDMREDQQAFQVLKGELMQATCCGLEYHPRTSAALHSLFHIQRTERALISMRTA